MSFNVYKNRLSQEIKYWENINLAKLLNSQILSSLPPLSDAEREQLPQGISRFYDLGRCFFDFLGSVVIPIKQMQLLMLLHHVADLFEYYTHCLEMDIPMPTSYEVYEFFNSIPFDSAQQICLSLCENRTYAEILIGSLMSKDIQSFVKQLSQLDLSKSYQTALVRTINVLKLYEFQTAGFESDKAIDPSILETLFKNHLNELLFHKFDLNQDIKGSHHIHGLDNRVEIFGHMVDVLCELTLDKQNPNLYERVSGKLSSYGLWLVFAKYVFCQIVYSTSLIMDILNQEEKTIVKEILDRTNDVVIQMRDVRIFPLQYFFPSVTRWGEIMRLRFIKKSILMNPSNAIEKEAIPEVSTARKNRFSEKNNHLFFPSRIKTYSNYHSEILKEFYKYYGGMFEVYLTFEKGPGW